MRSLATRLLLVLGLVFTPVAFAGDAPLDFASESERQRFNDLIEELRCLVCQNQSLADSNADLAEDLRLEVYEMFNQGKEEQEIVDYLVARYGDFVLYRPRLNASNFLLWFGPLIFLLIGIAIALSLLRRKDAPEVDEARLKYAEQLLDDKTEHNS